jgi:hypothetical protein
VHSVTATRMPELIFENLNFSFLIDAENRIAYLQEWRDGNWSEAEKFPLPQPFEGLHKQSLLVRAVRDFRGDGEYHRLCSALGAAPSEPLSWRDRLQAAPRLLAARIVQLIYA